MYTKALLLSALAALGSAAPVVSTIDASKSHNVFEVSNFVYGCTSTCNWYYDITVKNSSANHPATEPIHCEGSLDGVTNFDQGAKACASPSNPRQHISTYIEKSNNKLHIRYEYDPSAGYRYWYEGNQTVNAATSGKPQATDFFVPETVAYAIG